MRKRAKRGSLPPVRLQRGDFAIERAVRAARRPDCGAVVVYLGTVRSTPHGGGSGRVERLAYEAFAPMAVAKLAKVRAEALRRFDIKELFLHHRVGDFKVGENVVMCIAAAPHRQAALDACRFAVGEMKQTVPIWKKEIFAGGREKWVVGEMKVKEVVGRKSAARAR